MASLKSLLFAILILFLSVPLHGAERVLIVFEGKDLPTNPAKGDGLQLHQLLGHFQLDKEIIGAEDYKPGQADRYPFLFFVGFTKNCRPPSVFLDDVHQYRGTLIWLNTGILAYHGKHPLKTKYGFEPRSFDTESGFNSVTALDRNWKFTKSDPNLHILKIFDEKRVEVLAVAESPGKKSSPYAIRSGSFYYFADSPLAYTTPTDRYLFFANKLHDILRQPHAESHSALIRIEDVHPLENPDNLLQIADLLHDEGVPFLVSVTPFYVDPAKKIHVALSDKPDMVDALRYAQSKGGTIILHGVTHQYRGVTAADYEFWDEVNNRPLRQDSATEVEKKIESGIVEMIRNGLYPIAWETPHYSASAIDYRTIGKVFSTAMEVRLVLNQLEYSQFFPYVIHQDMYGQKILPENLGYVPLGEPKEMTKAVQELIDAARVNLYVADGFAAAFFHPFLPIDLLKELVDGVRRLGYTYVDIKKETHSVKLPDRMILTGTGSFTLEIDDQYLKEVYVDKFGKGVRKEISGQRITGSISRRISLEPGWTYVASPIEYPDRELTFFERSSIRLQRLWSKLPSKKKQIRPAVAAILWNPSASGGGLLDQQSFYIALRSVGIPVDQIPATSPNGLSKYNLLIVPYTAAEVLPEPFYEKVEKFLREGGHLVTDSKNPLAARLGVRFGKTISRIERVRDRLFPEELLTWETHESAYFIEVGSGDEVVCTNDANKTPIGIARRYGKGKFITLSTRFDPITGAGYSRFPYLVEWLKNYFQLYPVLRRDFIEVYFDPGLHKNLKIEGLVKRWSELGIRVVHVAGWHEYPKYTYNYDRLLRLCHAYGIVVYAWLEPPQISKKFYDDHPEWREKNHIGEDVKFDWRYPVALTDSACLAAATEWMRKFLSSHDWDGVNIAEIYFGGEGAPENSQVLTPFHPSARDQFEKSHGFDPVRLFQAGSPHFYKASSQSWRSFVDFRVNLVTQITAHFLSVAEDAFKTKPGAQIILTILDQKTVPELRTKIGVDVDQLLDLRKRFNFSLQVEDPESYWNKDPRRYLEIGRRYRELLGGDPSNLLIDLNILGFRKEAYTGPFPTLTPTGTESHLLVHSAATAAPRTTIYSEATILPQDLDNLACALAATARLEISPEGYRVKADYATTLCLDERVRQVSIDGRTAYPYRKGSFLIPAGEHVIKIKEPSVNLFNDELAHSQLAAASCNILEARTFKRGIEFFYESPSRCAVSFKKVPFAVFVDDQEVSFSVAKEEQNYGILLPPGKHKALVVLETPVSYGIDLTSLWSSELIAIFGIFAGSVLTVLFVLVKLKKGKPFRV